MREEIVSVVSLDTCNLATLGEITWIKLKDRAKEE